MSAAHTRPSRSLFAALAAAAAFALAAAPLAAQQPTHAYRVNGSLADELGGPSLQGLGGTVGSTGYTFGPGQGLRLANALAPSVYSLELAFRLNAVDGYRKIVDFNNRTQDFGFYAHNGFATFYPAYVSEEGTPQFEAGVLAHVVITRDADRMFRAYVNGARAFAISDVSGFATFQAPDAVAFLLQDDGGEHPSGFLDYVRTYDRPLTDAEVAARFAAGDDALAAAPTSTVPEPGSLALLGAGAVGLAGVARRRAAARA